VIALRVFIGRVFYWAVFSLRDFWNEFEQIKKGAEISTLLQNF